MGATCQFPFEPFHSCLFASFTLIFCSLYWMLPLLRKTASLGRQYLMLIKSDPSLPRYFWSRENILLTLVIKSSLPMSVRVLCILHRNPPSPSLLCLNSLCLSFTLTFGVPSSSSLHNLNHLNRLCWFFHVCVHPTPYAHFCQRTYLCNCWFTCLPVPLKHGLGGIATPSEYVMFYPVTMTLHMLCLLPRMLASICSTLLGTSKCYSSFRASQALPLSGKLPMEPLHWLGSPNLHSCNTILDHRTTYHNVFHLSHQTVVTSPWGGSLKERESFYSP